MSGNLSKWQRKRSVEDDEESEDAAMIEFGDESSEKERYWKVETLDEIPQEKRPRLDDREESAVEGTKQSSRNSSPSSVKRLSISSSPSHHSRSSSKHDSPGEVIYQLSPEQHNLSPLSSGSRTPSKKPKSPNDVVQSKTEKKCSAEEEEGEIVSDISDDERKDRWRKKSVDARDAKSSEALEDKGTTSGKTSADESAEESSKEESSDEESEEEEEEEVGKVAKEDTIMGRGKVENEEENSNSDEESESGESSDEEEEDEETKGNKTKQDGEGKESVDESSDESEEEGSSSAEESEDEEQQKSDVKEQINENEKATAVVEDEAEGEDLHKELKKLKDKKSLDERQRQTYRNRDEEYSRGSSWRKDSRLKDSGKERSNRERKPYSQDKAAPQEKSYSREKFHRDDRERRVASKEKTDNSKASREKAHRSSGMSKGRVERSSYGEKERPLPVRTSSDADRRASRKDYNKHKSSKESSKKESKPRVKRDASERVAVPKESKDKVPEDTKIPKEDAFSSVLTEKERRQFNREVVDLDSEESSTEEESALAPTSDVEMKSEGDEDRGEKEDEQEEEEDEEEKLPPYLPAVQGCRNVEEFQWLNRIEEGSYGVVYRAKDRRSGEVVALKKLKMEREKGGFPITSLREINTLLKAQHVNIVTVREIVVGSNMDKIYIVMDYVEHDLKTLMEHMTNQFRVGEVKTLLIQLLRAVDHLHDKWILHRDLKTSNLLLSNQGILKVGDFGLAREYGSPLKNYTPIVVTLWYRAPELLLGVKEYSTPIDLWSVGCIFAELLTMKPLFTGSSEIDQINKIFQELGTPSDKIWPGPPAYSELPFVKKMTFAEYPYNNLRNKFGAYLTDKGFDLLNRFLTYDPKKRITADDALKHHYFEESPAPVDPSFFPTWPARSEMMKRPKRPKDYEHSPDAPEGGAMFAKLAEEGDGSGNGAHGFRMPSSKKGSAAVAGFTLKF